MDCGIALDECDAPIEDCRAQAQGSGIEQYTAIQCLLITIYGQSSALLRVDARCGRAKDRDNGQRAKGSNGQRMGELKL